MPAMACGLARVLIGELNLTWIWHVRKYGTAHQARSRCSFDAAVPAAIHPWMTSHERRIGWPGSPTSPSAVGRVQ